jgi:hypothetical protein
LGTPHRLDLVGQVGLAPFFGVAAFIFVAILFLPISDRVAKGNGSGRISTRLSSPDG